MIILRKNKFHKTSLSYIFYLLQEIFIKLLVYKNRNLIICSNKKYINIITLLDCYFLKLPKLFTVCEIFVETPPKNSRTNEFAFIKE